MPSSVQNWSNSWLPEAARAREAKSRSVNSFPLSVNILAILIGQERWRSRRNLRALAGSLGRQDAHEHPPCRPVDGDEQIAPRVRRENCPPDSFLIRLAIRHLRQVFHVDMQVSRRIGLERLVRLSGGLGAQGIEIAHTMAAQ